MSSRKACSGCGAFNTPQWREGPYGPRTLCNACGVRYLRRDCGRPSDRKAQAKLARRNAHTAPGLKEHKASSSRVKRKPEASLKQKQLASTVQRQSCCQRVKEQSQPSQQSVQERFSESGNASDACHSSHSTIEDAAAANLIAMSKPSSLLHQTRAHFDEDWFGAKDTSHSAAEEYDANSQLQSCEQLQSTEAEMQAQFLSDLAAMREEVEAAEKKLAAANAAADAVSQVLIVKQAAVTSAWAVMADANQRLQDHIKHEPDFGDLTL